MQLQPKTAPRQRRHPQTNIRLGLESEEQTRQLIGHSRELQRNLSAMNTDPVVY
jgi:hypothetical protein